MFDWLLKKIADALAGDAKTLGIGNKRFGITDAGTVRNEKRKEKEEEPKPKKPKKPKGDSQQQGSTGDENSQTEPPKKPAPVATPKEKRFERKRKGGAAAPKDRDEPRTVPAPLPLASKTQEKPIYFPKFEATLNAVDRHQAIRKAWTKAHEGQAEQAIRHNNLFLEMKAEWERIQPKTISSEIKLRQTIEKIGHFAGEVLLNCLDAIYAKDLKVTFNNSQGRKDELSAEFYSSMEGQALQELKLASQKAITILNRAKSGQPGEEPEEAKIPLPPEFKPIVDALEEIDNLSHRVIIELGHKLEGSKREICSLEQVWLIIDEASEGREQKADMYQQLFDVMNHSLSKALDNPSDVENIQKSIRGMNDFLAALLNEAVVLLATSDDPEEHKAVRAAISDIPEIAPYLKLQNACDDYLHSLSPEPVLEPAPTPATAAAVETEALVEVRVEAATLKPIDFSGIPAAFAAIDAWSAELGEVKTVGKGQNKTSVPSLGRVWLNLMDEETHQTTQKAVDWQRRFDENARNLRKAHDADSPHIEQPLKAMDRFLESFIEACIEAKASSLGTQPKAALLARDDMKPFGQLQATCKDSLAQINARRAAGR